MPLVEVTTHYLEMTAPGDFRPRRAARDGVRFTLVSRPMPELNRFFYMTIGGDWFWLQRRPWTLSQWTWWVTRPELETWVLSVDALPAGYVELDRQAGGVIEIAYFGLLPAFTGQRLGAHLLTEGVERAWGTGASRVILNTCNLDHPRALSNYLASGFRAYRTDVRMKELPLEPPGPWDGAFGPF